MLVPLEGGDDPHWQRRGGLSKARWAMLRSSRSLKISCCGTYRGGREVYCLLLGECADRYMQQDPGLDMAPKV